MEHWRTGGAGGRHVHAGKCEVVSEQREKNVLFVPPPNCIPPPGNPPPKNILNSSSGLTSFSNLIPPPPPPDRNDGIPEERDSGSPPCESNAARKVASERTWKAFETTRRSEGQQNDREHKRAWLDRIVKK